MRKNIRYIVDSLRMMWQLDKTVFITSVFSSVIDAVVPYIGIILSAYILDSLIRGEDITRLIITAVTAVGSIFILTALKAYLDKISGVHTDICVRKFDMKMSERTLTMDYGMLDSPKVNDIRTRINNDNSWGAGFYSMIWMLPWLLSSVIGLAVAVIILIPLFIDSSLFSDPLSLALFGFYIAIVVTSSLFTVYNKKKSNGYLNKFNGEKSFLGYFLWGGTDYKSGKDIRVYSLKKLIKGYIDNDPPYRDYMLPMVRYTSAAGFAGGLSSGLLMTVSYLFVALRAVSGAFGIGSVLKYASVIYQFSSQLNSVMSAFAEYSVAAGRQQSTMEYMNVPSELYQGSLPVEKRAFCDSGDNDYEIEFRNVSFKYPSSDNFVLRDISIKLRVGERLAVVGMNGSGKTTFIKLLCRLYDPTEGEILLNGINIKKYDYGEYMSIFSVVFQDFKLFSFSLGQNIAADVDFDKARAELCLKKAGFGSRLNDMPDSTETFLYKDFDEKGVEISGGEAQKIALARALYKDAPFIILDEPTAALDPVAEFEIYSKFNEIVGSKTAIYISHRLSSCRFCDDIAVFDNGRIIQRGSHDMLVADKNGRYHELWYAQAQYYSE